MSPSYIIQCLDENREVFRYILQGSPVGLCQWRPVESSWCLLEIVCHLLDEEREDFRPRTQFALDNGQGHLASIDPVGWVQSRGYLNCDYQKTLESFLEERRNSLAWLHSLRKPNWSASFSHPKLGIFSAGKMLANWLAHDYHHIRQINKIKYAWLKDSSGEDLSYAGNWAP